MTCMSMVLLHTVAGAGDEVRKLKNYSENSFCYGFLSLIAVVLVPLSVALILLFGSIA